MRPLRMLETAKKFLVTFRYTMPGGGRILARKADGGSSLSLRRDRTVRFARPSAVRNRAPYPVSDFPTLLLKIPAGRSTFAPVSGMTYRRQSACCGAAYAGQTAKKTPETKSVVRPTNAVSSHVSVGSAAG